MVRSDIQLPDVRTVEIDGVPVYWAPMDGPLTAVLQFDGGICIEAPHERGIQHLIEHLVLTEVGPQAHEYNGFVDMRRVAFTVRGDTTEVRRFFEVVTSALGAIPPERADHESSVLSAEASRTQGSTLTTLLTFLFGSTGPGVSALPELGLGTIDAEAMNAWAMTRMTRGRAALACSGDPSFLDLSGVPGGERDSIWQMPAPIDGPGWAPNNGSGFAAVATMERSTATSTMVRTLRDHCLDHVRHRQGVSYNVEMLYEPITPDDALVGIFVDAAPDRRVVARNTLLEALDTYAAQGPEQRWIDLDADRLERSMREQGAGVGRAAKAAADHCMGVEDPLSNNWLQSFVELTRQDLAAAARTFVQSASWQMPNDAPMPPWRGLPRLRLYSDTAVGGRDLKPSGEPGYRMVAGADGLSIVAGPERVLTVRFDELVASEAWDDGTRMMYGSDGTRIRFSPKEWAEGDELVRWLDANLVRSPTLKRDGRPPV